MPTPGGTSRSNMVPWGIGGVSLVILAVLVLVRRSDSSLNATTLSVSAVASPGPPDISNMTPRERAERLYDRSMTVREAGKLDSATFFASMAIQAYDALPDRTLDDRYDVGRLALVAGQATRAQAEADTILAARPTHLLGLLLSEAAARARGDAAAASAAHCRLLDAAPTERQTNLPEYTSHATELTNALGPKGAATALPAPR